MTYITIHHPEIIPKVRDLPFGLLPVSVGGESHPRLIVKTTKEMLLAAKVNQGFKIYLSPITLSGKDCIGLISAFFDDEDEPLAIRTPLFSYDDFTDELLETLKCEVLHIHLFDEHNRELLGYVANLVCPSNTRDRLANALFCKFGLELAKSAHDQMTAWFGSRSHDDDISAIQVLFSESLTPEGILFLDTQPNNHLYPGSPHFSFSKLEREEPGAFQEQDIARLLREVFLPTQIYLNPRRVTENEEIADILVLTESEVIVVQAKDSPNIERVLKNPIGRKRATAKKALSKAIDQMRGAIRYIRADSPLVMVLNGETLAIDVSSRTLRGLIVVKELFSDEYSIYSPLILELSQQTEVPCIALDYPELRSYSALLNSEESFLEAFDRVFSHGLETGQFPRLRIWPRVNASRSEEMSS